jgi:hypothetical protein
LTRSLRAPCGRILEDRECQVVRMRARGSTWQTIGDALGITRQRAHQIGRKPHVRATIEDFARDHLEAARTRLSEGYWVAVEAMIEIASDKDHPQRLTAARHLVQAVDGIRAEIVVTDTEQRQRAAMIAASMSDADLQIEAAPLVLEGDEG